MEMLTRYTAISSSLGCSGADLIFLMTSGSHLNRAGRKPTCLSGSGVTCAEEMHPPALKHKGKLLTYLDRQRITTLTVV